MRILRIAAAFTALWVAVAQSASEPRDVFAEVDHLVGELTKISGFQPKHRVACHLITRDEVNRYLQKRMKEVASPAEIRAEELSLKKLGLVPPDFDLARTTVDLLTEQAAAFYDFHNKKLYITETTPSATREAALVHELAHALADQQFNLERYLKHANKSDDGALARMAVMEGQATWLMSEYLAREMGQSLADSPSLVEIMSRSSDSASGQFPVFEGAPLYMRATLLFPYGKGMLFQQAVFEKSGRAAFSEVFRHPPLSTQQVLHPEKYMAGIAPTHPAPPVLPSTRGYKTLITGAVGELDHAILLEQYSGKETAQDLAPHWRGGQFKLFENARAKRVVLSYCSEWDGPEAARRYFDAYRQVLEKKWKKLEVSSATPERFAGLGDDGHFAVELRNTVVTSLEGTEAP